MEKESFLKKNKKKIILFSFIGVLVVVLLGFILIQLLFPNISLNIDDDSYEYSEFIEVKRKVKSTLFVSKKKTIWNINGYDFYQGKEHSAIPVVVGSNTLTITNGKLSKTYKFEITDNDNTVLLIKDDRFKINDDYLDYDGDGITNKLEKEKGLSTYSKDTDNDGLLDNVELVMGLDPKKKDDYKKERTYKVHQDDSKDFKHYLNVTGTGNIANTFLDTSEFTQSLPDYFVKSDVLKVVTSNTEKPSKMTLYFDKGYSFNTDRYSIYSYNETSGDLKELKTKSNDDYLYADIDIFNNLYFVGQKDKAPTGEYKNEIMILIDNSGSMFTKEYVEKAENITISDDKANEYAHDVEFKRLSLMNGLVNRLGVKDYYYSVYAFTNSYCDIVTSSRDKKTITDGINSLKTSCQNFNGTDMSGSIRKYSSKFDFNSYGKKYMIVLTDGIDSGWFTYELADYTLEGYAKKGINIITIGLSNFTNSEYLMRIASKTNGKYLYASDANMLDTLVEIIESSIEGQKTESIDGDEVTLIADSGFIVKRDGFNIENFGSTSSPGGNCFGFSLLSRDIYLNKFKESDKFVDGGFAGTDLIEYTLTDKNKERLVKGNVYNIKLNKTYSTLLNVDPTSPDYRYLGDDGIPYLNKKIKDLTPNSGFNPYIKDLGDKKVELTIGNKTDSYSKYESLGNIDLSDIDNVSDKNKDDYQVLQLINRNWAVQTHYIGEVLAQHFAKKAQGKFYDYELQAKLMMKKMQAGEPVLLSITASAGNHSVLATKAYKTNDLEKYIIHIYDSNTPDGEKNMYLERQVSYNLFSETSYYSLNYVNGGFTFYEMIVEDYV